MDYDDEGKSKDDKIYDLFKQAMQQPNLLEKLKWARIISFQLETKHETQLPKEFLIKKERDWLQDLLLNAELTRDLELRYRVTDGTEGYKYFDRIANDNPNDVFNHGDELEASIRHIELRLTTFFAVIVKTLDISDEGDDL